MESHLQPLRRRADLPLGAADRRARPTFTRCVELMATQYQWSETTRANAHDYLAAGRFRAFCQARGIATVDELTNEAVLDFMADLRDKVQVSRNTLRRYRNYFRRLADFCATTPGYHNPRLSAAAVPKVPKAPARRRPDALTVAEERALVAAVARDRRNSLVLRLMLACGLRVSEVCALVVDDVKAVARPPRVLVSKGHSDITKTGVDRQVTFRQPYGGLAKDLAQWIERYRPTMARRELFGGERRAAGQPITVRAVQLMLRRAAHRAGIRPVHPHLLRRTWATRLADAGASATDLMQQAGWSSIEMVNVYYAGAEERALERVASLRVDG